MNRVATISLSTGGTTLVDEADLPQVTPFRWNLMRDGYVRHAWHIPQGGSRAILLHRIVLDAPVGVLVDHINGVKTDNRRCNLRLASHAQNARHVVSSPNQKRGRFKGVTLLKSGLWQAVCAQVYLGAFATAEEAAAAYDASAQSQFGEFASTNLGASL